jgi:hypothetical protein
MPDPKKDDKDRLVAAARKAEEFKKRKAEEDAAKDAEEMAKFFGDRPTVKFDKTTDEERTKAEMENLRGIELQAESMRKAEATRSAADRQAASESFWERLVGPKPSADLQAARERLHGDAVARLKKRVNDKVHPFYEKVVPDKVKAAWESLPQAGYNPAKDSRNVRQPKEFKREK